MLDHFSGSCRFLWWETGQWTFTKYKFTSLVYIMSPGLVPASTLGKVCLSCHPATTSFTKEAVWSPLPSFGVGRPQKPINMAFTMDLHSGSPSAAVNELPELRSMKGSSFMGFHGLPLMRKAMETHQCGPSPLVDRYSRSWPPWWMGSWSEDPWGVGSFMSFHSLFLQ